MLGKRIINTATGAGAACTTDTVQILGDTSCVAYYKMSDATDETGSYDGTPTNVNFNVAGKFGNAGEFNGSSSSIATPITTNYSNLSISCWVKFNALPTGNADATLVSKGFYVSGSNTQYLHLRYEDFTDQFTFAIRQNSTYNQQAVSGVTATTGVWYHVVGTLDSSGNAQIYVNGSAGTGITSAPTMTNSDDFEIGSFATTAAVLNGKIDQIRIFDKAITANEVTTLYNEVYCQPTIVPTDHFEPVLYTGNGGTQSISTLDFAPDFVWMKNRNSTQWHGLYDNVRGAGKWITSNATNAEADTAGTTLTSFNIDGFSLGDDTNGYGANTNNNTYVAWNWRAGAAAVSNTDGTITSQVSANTDAGFSIVTWTGNGADATVGHGLSSVPELVITKGRANLATYNNWITYHKDLSTNHHLYLNTTVAEQDGIGDYFRDAAFSSTVIGLGDDIYGPNVNNTTMVAYCFHSVDGMSKIGSYVGTGASNSIVTGFRPAYVMIKGAVTSNATNWWIFDNKRNPDNPLGKGLLANSSSAEQAQATYLDFNSNGFTWLSGSGEFNSSGDTFIFMAFAEENVEPQPVLANSFNTVTYTGTGTTGGNTLPVTGFGFQPDLVWIKNRDVAVNHYLYDSVRGTGAAKALHSNATSSESTASVYAVNGGVSSFLSDGFTAYRGTDNTYQGTNMNGQDYVAWCWKASNESTINQEGSTTSIVSANPAAGFSIVKYTGNGTAGATVGHNLSSAPELIFYKRLDSTANWIVKSTLLSTNNYLLLNATDASTSDGGVFWNSTVPSSALFTLGNSLSVNGSSASYIAYCFHSVDGYQKVGSYSGSGGAGNAQDVGFEPSFVMIKRYIGAVSNWVIFDTLRTDGSGNKALYADLSNAEASDGRVNLTSTGFDFDGAAFNESSTSWIYLAIKAN